MAARTHPKQASLAIAVASVVLALAGCTAGTVTAAGPPTPTRDLPTASGTPTPSATQPTSTAQAPSIAATALLTIADLQPSFTREESFDAPWSPNPFLGCGPDGLPGNQQPLAAIGVGFTGGDVRQSLFGGESVMRFGTNGAHLTVAAINQLISGPCAGRYQIVGTSLGGAESVLVQSNDPETVIPQAAHGVALYYAIIRQGAYLVWVTLIDQSHEAAPTDVASTLARRGSQRLCAAVSC